jgi:hypothetical protein
MKFYDKNMQLLKENFEGVYNKIKNAEKKNRFELTEVNKNDLVAKIEDYKNEFIIFIEKSRLEEYTMKIKKENKELYFHSKYAPEREAKKIVKNFGYSSKKQIFVLGTGLGYYLNQFDKDNKYDKIIVIEPFLSIFYAALCYNDLSGFLIKNNITLIINNNDKIFHLTLIKAIFDVVE